MPWALLARGAGDVQTGAYVMATSLHTSLQGHLAEAVDMAQGAYEQGKHLAAPRVLAFAKLAEARAHGRAGDGRAVGRALSTAENLLSSIRPGTRDVQQLSYLTHARISADAVEIYRDLGDLKSALRFSHQADAMPIGVYTRAVGIRQTVFSSAHIQAGVLDQGLAYGERAVDILSHVRSTRAHHVRQLTQNLRPWRREPRGQRFVRTSAAGLTTT
ncbi:hypothetical protein K1Y78_42150 [Streptomyces sp. tea 10]|nr:hypothetical protein [Streptomyces sp. tea 10]